MADVDLDVEADATSGQANEDVGQPVSEVDQGDDGKAESGLGNTINKLGYLGRKKE